ncbi:hypothetical protein [Methanobrevibacter filiformis]|uniref:Putative monovalent cation/H+ antiporter subunit G n=1 Tax=Methanobrevibacter filiformis TaxID=55758 RepID=A0A166C089_9EURY|nr:hypothetical protein [Methanobrevibacter filiformis]KZX13995.1 putative monovalent cation/H+ antiporter subunit G [Methanobrevibacter filiformis]
MQDIIEIIRAICLLISAALIIITAIGILRLDDDKYRIIYAKIHILGIMDIAGVLALIAMDQILLGAIYFVLAPIVAHAMANAYYYGEEDRKISIVSSDNVDNLGNLDNINNENTVGIEDNNGSMENNNVDSAEVRRNEARAFGIDTKELHLIHESNNISTLDKFQDDQIRSLKDEKYIISTLKIGEDEDD